MGSNANVAPYNRFNPRSPRGERPAARRSRPPIPCVSIHAPLAGSDTALGSTWVGNHVSIHAPLAGSDYRAVARFRSRRCFNPRSPRGERHFSPTIVGESRTFQSTLPSRGATRLSTALMTPCTFQSTLPSRGATRPPTAHRPRHRRFNPRSPRGERRVRGGGVRHPRRSFNPRSPRGERRPRSRRYRGVGRFQSTLPSRGATFGSSYVALVT